MTALLRIFSERDIHGRQSDIQEALIAAYQTTRYKVGTGSDAFVLKIDAYSKDLSALLLSLNQRCAVFITAFNPYSQPTSAQENLDAHKRLLRDLSALTSHIIEGAGADASGEWPAEESYLALGIDLARAC